MITEGGIRSETWEGQQKNHKKKILFIVNNRNVVVVVFFALVLYLLRTDARAIEISFTSSNGSSHPFYSDCHPPLFLSDAGQPIKLLLAGRRSILFSIVNSEIYIFGRLLWRMKHFLLRLF
jgi:hypothetical protein